MSEQSFDYTGFYLIVLTDDKDNQYHGIHSIFQDCWQLYIANVNVLTTFSSESSAILYTYFPYTKERCEDTHPVVLNYFAGDKFVSDSIYPDKFRNFYKCPLTLATYHIPPYMILTPMQNGSYHTTDGIDGITFRVISQQLNFTPIIRVPAEKSNTVTGRKRNQTFEKSFTFASLKMVRLHLQFRFPFSCLWTSKFLFSSMKMMSIFQCVP